MIIFCYFFHFFDIFFIFLVFGEIFWVAIIGNGEERRERCRKGKEMKDIGEDMNENEDDKV